MNYEMQKFRSSGRKSCLFLNVFAQPDHKFLHFVSQRRLFKQIHKFHRVYGIIIYSKAQMKMGA